MSDLGPLGQDKRGGSESGAEATGKAGSLAVGVAVCDLDLEYTGRLQDAFAIETDVLELQPEVGSWEPARSPRSYRFLAVHAPSQGRDIASPDGWFREFSVEQAKWGMRFASIVGADAYLLHPGQVYEETNPAGILAPPGYRYTAQHYWDAPSSRTDMLPALEASLDDLTLYQRQSGFPQRLTIENMPFPNLGTTFAEIEQIHVPLCRRYGLGITLDLGHLWISLNILLRHPEVKPFVPAYPGGLDTFYDDLAAFVERYRDLIAYYHLYGATAWREHLPVEEKESYSPDELDLYRVAKAIGADRPLVAEVLQVPGAIKLQSARNLREIFLRALDLR